MSRLSWAAKILGCTAVIAVGLGIGFWTSRRWGGNATPLPSSSSTETRAPVNGPATYSPELPSILAAGSDGKHALLVGVTRYDHLPASLHLSGPANDVRLMRQLLEKQYRFHPDSIVSLTEHEAVPQRRPTRANIAREFQRLAQQVHTGDQVVILLAGHGAQQPERDPPDLHNPEPDGLDEIFLPADVKEWNADANHTREGVANAIVDNDLRTWLEAITAKQAYVWIIFDCCHSGDMTRGTEVVRELPPDTLVPRRELEKARRRAAQRSTSRGGPVHKLNSFLPADSSDYLVAVYACRPEETTPESPQPADSLDARYHGLLTYSLVDILSRSAASKASLTYRDLVQRLQVQYAARHRGSPTPLVEGKGQDRVILGVDQPVRPRLLLTRDGDVYKVNAGDLYGLTAGSVLAVHSPAGSEREPKLLGHVRVQTVRPFDATAEPCAYEQDPLVADLPPFSTCQAVFIDYGSRRLKVALQIPEEQRDARQRLRQILQPLTDSQRGMVEWAADRREAEWLLRLQDGRVQLVEASGKRSPFVLPAWESEALRPALRRNLDQIYRARNLIALAGRFEEDRYSRNPAVNVEVEVLKHTSRSPKGEVLPRPSSGWVFRPGDVISFRIHNKSPSLRLDVTLLIVGSDYQIQAFYPQPGRDVQVKSVDPGKSFDTPPPYGEIGNDPPFGLEHLVVIATPATNPPIDFTALMQEGLRQARSADRSQGLKSPLGELLESAMFRSGSRRGLTRTFADQHGMRLLTWRTEAGNAAR